MDKDIELVDLSAKIVSAYVANNYVSATDIPSLIAGVHNAVSVISNPHLSTTPKVIAPVPAVPIKNSVTPDFIICLENGKGYKTLKRHLMATYGMTPEEYREKWGLPANYPMTAPNYSDHRSSMAKNINLGRVGRSARLAKLPKKKS